MNKHYNLIHNYDWKDGYQINRKFLIIRIDDQYVRRVRMDYLNYRITNDDCRASNGIYLSDIIEGECIHYARK